MSSSPFSFTSRANDARKEDAKEPGKGSSSLLGQRTTLATSSRIASPTLRPAAAANPGTPSGPSPFSQESSLRSMLQRQEGTSQPSSLSSSLGTKPAETPSRPMFKAPAAAAATTPSSGLLGARTGTLGAATATAPTAPSSLTARAEAACTSLRSGEKTSSFAARTQPAFRPSPTFKAQAEGSTTPFRSSPLSGTTEAGKRSPLSQPQPLFRPVDGAGRTSTPTMPNFKSFTGGLIPPTTSSPFRKELQISDEEFLQLRDFIYQQCGIFIAENRKYLIENRLSNRIKELNLKSYSEYYNFLRFDGSRREELNKLFEVVTTNETSFFRNPPQLKVFQETVLAEVIAACRKNGKKRIRIWSAGCSTGEEPYTMAIILHEVLKGEIGSWDIKITANDLSEAVLAAARRGMYNEYSLRTTPPELVRAYFTKEGNSYKLNPELKRLVSFGQINLSDKEQLRRVEKSQIVFCRNVIIYFDDEMKKKVINAFYDNLEPNGMLLIGHSESLHNISRAFKPEHHTGTIVYRKMG